MRGDHRRRGSRRRMADADPYSGPVKTCHGLQGAHLGREGGGQTTARSAGPVFTNGPRAALQPGMRSSKPMPVFRRVLGSEECAVVLRRHGEPLLIRGPGAVRTFYRWRQVSVVNLSPFVAN